MSQSRSSAKVHLFEAPSIFEAYSKLKSKLGPNAVILSTRSIKKGGILGLWGQKVVQITASVNVKAPRRIKEQAPSAAVINKMLVASINQKNAGANTATMQAPPPPTETPSIPQQPSAPITEEPFSDVRSELEEIRKMVEEIQHAGRYRHWPDLPPAFQKAFEKLQGYNINEDISRALIHRWRSHYPDYEKGMKVDVGLLEKYISEMVVPAGPINIKGNGKPTVVMMVGPTGVGKTTSIAKLAARYKIKEGMKVALVTIDTYRIAAVEQLRTYADLIGLPFKVVSTPNELIGVTQQYSDQDIILIDTAGRSPRNTPKMDDLMQFVDACKIDELHLVLSMSTNNEVMKDTVERFAAFPVNKLLLTKLDEAVHFGVILSILSKTQKPIGYITTGQEVPDDIEVGDVRRMSRLILGLEKIRE